MDCYNYKIAYVSYIVTTKTTLLEDMKIKWEKIQRSIKLTKHRGRQEETERRDNRVIGENS